MTTAAFALPASLLSQGYRLRPEEARDIPFLMQLYASTREKELAPVPWTGDQKVAFLTQQFDAQRRYYRDTIEDCRFEVLEHNGEPVGRLYLQERPARMHIVDIALMPSRRGLGLGTQILQALQGSAGRAGRGVGIMVEKFNPALNLYRRLGFTDVKDHGVYLEMEWMPDAASTLS